GRAWSRARAGECLQKSDGGAFRQDRDSGPENDIGSAPPRPSRGAHRAVGRDVTGVIAEAALSACMGSVGCGRAGVVGRGEMTIPPVEDGLEALPTMARLTGPGQLVVLSREDEHLGVHPCPLQGRVVLLRLFQGAAEVELRMHHQRRCPHLSALGHRDGRAIACGLRLVYSSVKKRPMSEVPTKLSGSRYPRSTMAPRNRSSAAIVMAVRYPP